MEKSAFKLSIFILAIALSFLSCSRDNNNPGYVYLPDMDESRAYETYSENPVFADGKTMRVPVEGTVSRGDIPYPYKKDDADLALAGKTIKNPISYTPEIKERGEVLYGRFCIQCHGINGDGKGHLFTSGKYPYPPANLTLEKTKVRPDGEVYHIITVGYGIMGAHGPQIPQEDRWKIISYVRNELQK